MLRDLDIGIVKTDIQKVKAEFEKEYATVASILYERKAMYVGICTLLEAYCGHIEWLQKWLENNKADRAYKAASRVEAELKDDAIETAKHYLDPSLPLLNPMVPFDKDKFNKDNRLLIMMRDQALAVTKALEMQSEECIAALIDCAPVNLITSARIKLGLYKPVDSQGKIKLSILELAQVLAENPRPEPSTIPSLTNIK